VPHAVRMLVGPDHRILLPASVLAGGAFLTAADAVARSVLAPSEIPVGVITALVGGPCFLYFLVYRKGGLSFSW
jgi:iron complex transport system permease protein